MLRSAKKGFRSAKRGLSGSFSDFPGQKPLGAYLGYGIVNEVFAVFRVHEKGKAHQDLPLSVKLKTLKIKLLVGKTSAKEVQT